MEHSAVYLLFGMVFGDWYVSVERAFRNLRTAASLVRSAIVLYSDCECLWAFSVLNISRFMLVWSGLDLVNALDCCCVHAVICLRNTSYVMFYLFCKCLGVRILCIALKSLSGEFAVLSSCGGRRSPDDRTANSPEKAARAFHSLCVVPLCSYVHVMSCDAGFSRYLRMGSLRCLCALNA